MPSSITNKYAESAGWVGLLLPSLLRTAGPNGWVAPTLWRRYPSDRFRQTSSRRLRRAPRLSSTAIASGSPSPLWRQGSTNRPRGGLGGSWCLRALVISSPGWFTDVVAVREGEAPAEPARREARPPATVTRSRALVNHAVSGLLRHDTCLFGCRVTRPRSNVRGAAWLITNIASSGGPTGTALS